MLLNDGPIQHHRLSSIKQGRNKRVRDNPHSPVKRNRQNNRILHKIEMARSKPVNQDALSKLKDYIRKDRQTPNEDFPPTIENPLQFYENAYKALDPKRLTNISVCACCSLKFPCIAKPNVHVNSYTIDSIPIEVLQLLKNNIPLDHPNYEIHEFTYNHEVLENLMLDLKGINVNQNSINLCTVCHEFLLVNVCLLML